MSQALRNTVAEVADELARRAVDLRRERPADLTPEESDARVAAALERLARTLRDALRQSVQT